MCTSSSNPATREALRWLRFSGEDIGAASLLMRSTPRHSCWLCQQAAEKALKAALVAEGIRFPFIHDLDALRNLLPDGWPVRNTHGNLSWLAEWAADARYPGNWPEPTYADATRAYSEARSVRDSVVAEFRRRGMFI